MTSEQLTRGVSSPAIACYVPGLVLRRLAREPAQPGRPNLEAERIDGAVLFSDISGFTALAERLAARGPVGAERLSELLNDYFGELIALILKHGGDVLKLAGDALVALWPATDEPLSLATLRAAQCGLAVQATLNRREVAEGIRLQSKIGIGAGQVAALHVGGVLGRWELLIAGAPLVQIGLAEREARPGDVVLSPTAWSQVRDACAGAPVGGGHVRLESLAAPLPLRPARVPPPPDGSEGVLRGYIPAAILSRLDAGQTDWLGELRSVTVLFLNLPDLDLTTPAAQARTQEVIRALQSTLYRYEGSVNKLSIDDKGLTLVAALGLPPLSHEDDPARGVQTALEMQEVLRGLDARGAIGVATGRVYCGEIGGADRREYTVIGDKVNLAARLMQAAPGTVLCDAATRQAARGRFAFEALPAIVLKGKAHPVPVFRPSGQSAGEGGPSPLFGRAAERAFLGHCLGALVDGQGGRVAIEGEAGIGKSRLVADLVARAQARGITVLAGEADAVEKSTPYFAWRPVVAQLLGADGLDGPDAQRARVLERLGDDPELVHLAPLLNAFLALDFPENELTEPMTGRVRAENTHTLVIRLLDAAARRGPTVLLLEDAHWLDSASWALTLQVGRRVPLVLLILSLRPMAGPVPADCRTLLQAPGTERLRLGMLGPDEALALVCQRLGVASLPQAAAQLIHRKAQGNPFFCEELAYALRDLRLIEIDNGACRPAPDVDWSTVAFPDSIQGVITNRIDRLQPSHQLTLKVSSVIGRLFPLRVLRDIFPLDPERPRLPELLDDLTGLDFTLVETPEPDLAFLFKHIIIQEVSYNMLLFSHRRQLHRSIAEWYERTQSEDLSPYYPLLAYHWGRAEVDSKATDYLERAGDQALRGGAYQEAVVFLRDATRLDDKARSLGNGPRDPDRRARWEAKLGEAHLGLGQLAESRAHTERALMLLKHPVPVGRPRLVAEYALQLSRQAAHRVLPSWLSRRSREPADVLRRSSCAYDVISQVCYYTQDVAMGVFSALRALNLAERSGPCPELARSYATMCIAASLVPLHSLAEAYGRRAWKTVEAIDDLATRAWVSEMLGVYWLSVGRWEESREKLRQAVEITRRLGDWRRWEESLGELARLEYLRGDFATGAALFGELGGVAHQQDHEQAQVWGLHGQSTNWLRQGEVEKVVGLLEKSRALQPDYHNVADTILGLGLLAAARLRLGQVDAALRDAEAALRRIERTRPVANYNLEGYAGAAEVFLSEWEAHLRRSGNAPRPLRRNARRACGILRQFAAKFPIALPRAWACWGLQRWLSGNPGAAWVSWRLALRYAERLDMPYEEGLIHHEIGRHADARDHARAAHLARAAAIFHRLGAADDLARLERTRASEAGPPDQPA